MVTRSMAAEAQQARLYVMHGERAKAIALAKKVGVDVEIDGITLLQSAISAGQFVLGRDLRTMGAKLTPEDRRAVEESILRHRNLLNNGFSWSDNTAGRIKKRLEEMENFLAPLRGVRRGN